MKKFRVAKAGPTTDGRVIKPEWLTDIADTYDPNLYTARIFSEHIRGVTADSAFFCGGDVVAVEAHKNDAGEMCLYAEIKPNDKFKELNQADQKVFPSIEVVPNFNNSGKYYLGGLGATDSPASLATEKFQFSTNSNFASGITGKNNVYMGEALNLSDIFEEPAAASAMDEAKLEGIFSRIFSKLFGDKTIQPAASVSEASAPARQPAASNYDDASVFASSAAHEFAEAVRPIIAQEVAGFAKQSDVDTLSQRLSEALNQRDPAHQHRQQSDGSGAGDRPKAEF